MLPVSGPEGGPAPRPRPGSAAWPAARRSPWVVVTALALVAVLAAGCNAGSSPGSGGQVTRLSAGAGSGGDLRTVCPATIVVQSSWFPQVEHAAVYQLLGQGYRVDADRKRVTGPLVAPGGADTGVRLEIRAGGPAIGYQQVTAQMGVDKTITLGMVSSDQLIQQSAAHPALGVVAPLELDPQVIFWDPQAHPDWNTVADIGQTDVPVLYFQSSPFMEYLLGSGILRASQVDGSYNGGPDRFVAARGRIAVQGYATNEPWAWSHEVPAWGKPLRYTLIHDTGFPNYANVLAIRPGDRSELDGCLRRLVPMVQRAQADFLADPRPVSDLVVRLVETYRTGGFFYSRELADYAVRTMRDEGIVAGGVTPAVGDVEPARIERLISILRPIFASQRKPIRTGLRAADVVTNDYIDPTIGLTQ